MSNNVESEYLDIVNRNAWSAVYQGIRSTCEKYQYTFNEAKKPQNNSLNRYMDVNPFDHSRVILRRGPNDYINANIVNMERANRKYILTQGPLPVTVGDFWLMVWEQNCRTILMLNKVIEKDQIKCHWYWPQDIGSEYALSFEEAGLEIEQLSCEDHSNYSTRVFRLTDIMSNTSREVIQFHYTTWPDFGVPSSPHAFLEFLHKVRASGGVEPNVGPPVVHCSAGIGRSGTFCLVDSCLVLIEKDGLNSVNVQEILLEMRKDRMGLIQTPDQLRFSYQAIIEGTKRLNPDYEECEMDINDEESAEEEITPPPPPPRAESLRPSGLLFRPLPAIPTSESLDNFQPSDKRYDIPVMSSQMTNGVGSIEDKLPCPPPTKELPEAPSDSDDDQTEPTMDVDKKPEVAAGIRQRSVAQADFRERVQQIKRKQRESEHWHSIKRVKNDNELSRKNF